MMQEKINLSSPIGDEGLERLVQIGKDAEKIIADKASVEQFCQNIITIDNELPVSKRLDDQVEPEFLNLPRSFYVLKVSMEYELIRLKLLEAEVRATFTEHLKENPDLAAEYYASLPEKIKTAEDSKVKNALSVLASIVSEIHFVDEGLDFYPVKQ